MDKDLFDFLAEFNLRPVLLGLLLEFHAHLVGKAVRDIASAEVVRHQECIDRKGKGIHRIPDIDPVGCENLLDFVREFKGRHDLFRGVPDRFHEIRVLQEHLRLAHRRHGEDVHGVVDPSHEQHKFVYFVSPARELRVDLIRHPAVARVQGDVDAVRRLQETVGLRYGQPVNVDTHIVEERADLQAVLLRSDTHHLMQRSLDLDPVPDIARGEAAGQIVLFEDQDILDPSRLQLQRTGESCKARAHDDDIIVVFVKVHVFHLANKV